MLATACPALAGGVLVFPTATAPAGGAAQSPSWVIHPPPNPDGRIDAPVFVASLAAPVAVSEPDSRYQGPAPPSSAWSGGVQERN